MAQKTHLFRGTASFIPSSGREEIPSNRPTGLKVPNPSHIPISVTQKWSGNLERLRDTREGWIKALPSSMCVAGPCRRSGRVCHHFLEEAFLLVGLQPRVTWE